MGGVAIPQGAQIDPEQQQAQGVPIPQGAQVDSPADQELEAYRAAGKPMMVPRQGGHQADEFATGLENRVLNPDWWKHVGEKGWEQVKEASHITGPVILHDLYAAKHGDPEAQERLKKLPGTAVLTFAGAGEGGIEAGEGAGAGASAIEKPGLVSKITKGAKAVEPQARQALSESAASALEKMPETVVSDKFPVKLKYDDAGNVVDLDGRHRVMQAIKNGDKEISVQVTARDGTTSTVRVDPQQVADKFGVTEESLKATDAQQAGVRAGGGEPRKPATQVTIQKAAPSQPSASLRESLSQPIKRSETNAKNLYSSIDEASGTDFKALRQKLSNTNHQIRLLTDTEEDVAKEAQLEKSRTALMDKIEEAKATARQAGVDPKTLEQADSAFKQTEALRDVEAKVFKNARVVEGNVKYGTPETVNVDKAVEALQKLQDDTRYGAPRLEQALGKENAQQLLKQMYQAQREGVHAMKLQKFAKWVTAAAGAGALAGGAGHLVSMAGKE